MAVGTKIEWTHRPGTIPATMNALVGCQKVSDGCRGCYAIDTAHVRAGNPLPVMQQKFAGTTKREGGKTVWTGKVTLSEKALLAPLRKKKPHTYFVNSMSDLFYDGVPDEWIDRHFAVFALCPQHTFIVLTKRPERMRSYLSQFRFDGHYVRSTSRENNERDGDRFLLLKEQQVWPLPNVWLGVSVENQKTADERIPLLLQTPAAVRFLSCEPLLGPVWFRWAMWDSWTTEHPHFEHAETVEREGRSIRRVVDQHDGLRMLDWVIAGGESGRSARPMHPDWARSLRDQCAAAGVPFFFKQWGEWAPTEAIDVFPAVQDWDRQPDLHSFGLDDAHKPRCAREEVWRVGKKLAGDLLDGVQHHAFPESR